MRAFGSSIKQLPAVHEQSILEGRDYAGLRGACAVGLPSSARECTRHSTAPLSGNPPRACIHANPASLMKYPG